MGERQLRFLRFARVRMVMGTLPEVRGGRLEGRRLPSRRRWRNVQSYETRRYESAEEYLLPR